VRLDKETSSLVAETVKGMVKWCHNDGEYSKLSSDGFIRNKKDDIKIINLFDEFDLHKCVNLENGVMTMKINTSKLLSRKLLNEGTLIDVTGFRGIGKT